MAERCHPKAIISSNIVSFPFYKLRKENPGEALVPTQLRPSFSGGPVPEVMAVKCNKCKDGSCSEHQKAA